MNELIELIYAAAVEPSRWPDLCYRLDDLFDATTVNIVLASEGNPHLYTNFATGASEADTAYYLENVFAIDETVIWAGEQTGESVHVYPPAINGTAYSELQATKLFYERMDWWKTVIVKFVSSRDNTAVLAISRGKAGPDYSAAEVKLLEQLLPHLKRAFYLNDSLSTASLKTQLAMDAVHAFDAAILVIDDTGTVQLKNRKADNWIESGLIGLRGSQFTLPERSADRALRDQIHSLQQLDKPVRELGTPIPYSYEQRAFIAYCVPYYRPNEALLWVNGYVGASIFIFEQLDEAAIPLSILATSYKLTTTEAQVLQLMVSSHSTEAAAAKLQISKDAIRFHLKNMYQKTGTSRQSELIALVHRTLGKLLFEQH